MKRAADRLAGVLRVLRLVAPADAAEIERIHAAEDAEADIADGDNTHPLDAVLREVHAAERDYYAASADLDSGIGSDPETQRALDERFGGGLDARRRLRRGLPRPRCSAPRGRQGCRGCDGSTERAVTRRDHDEYGEMVRAEHAERCADVLRIEMAHARESVAGGGDLARTALDLRTAWETYLGASGDEYPAGCDPDDHADPREWVWAVVCIEPTASAEAAQ